MISENLRRVFFHELGHFVAKEINFLNGEGTGTASISFTPNQEEPGEFHGVTAANRPTGLTANPLVPPERLAVHIASLMYGCFFQVCYAGETLINCLERYGIGDASQRSRNLDLHGFGFDKAEFSAVENDYLQTLVGERHLDEFFQLDPEIFLVEHGHGYEVDMTLLREHTQQLIERHRTMYRQLINRYNEMIAQGGGRKDLDEDE